MFFTFGVASKYLCGKPLYRTPPGPWYRTSSRGQFSFPMIFFMSLWHSWSRLSESSPAATILRVASLNRSSAASAEARTSVPGITSPDSPRPGIVSDPYR